jgi:hypothetical protein
MGMNFTKWYRSTLNRDGRVVWWEHVYAFVPFPTAIALFATRYWQTIWPTAIAFLASLAFALWSWRQDLIVHNTDVTEGANTVHDPDAKVPWLSKIFAVAFVVTLGVIVSNWYRTGHY